MQNSPLRRGFFVRRGRLSAIRAIFAAKAQGILRRACNVAVK